MKKYFNKKISIIFITILIYTFFILYIALFKRNLANELISENYYLEEMEYEKVIHQKNNANNLLKTVKLDTSKKDGIHLKFPKIFNFKNTNGKISLIRYSNKKQDIYQKLSLKKNNEHIISSKYLISGLYKIKVYWTYSKKQFLIEKNILWKNYS